MPQLTDEELEKYREAGKIAVEVMRKAKKMVSKGRKLIIICEGLGARPAFPVNISINQIAAHYTSPIDDELKIPERAIVKIDLGAHIDGYISDHAKTFLVGGTKTYQKLKKTAEKLKDMGNDFPAVERNLKRILASIKMLELNVSDLVLTEENDLSPFIKPTVKDKKQ